MSHQHSVFGWRVERVPFVGQEWMIQDTGFLPQLWKIKKTCGLKWILRCCGSSKSTITFGRTMGNLHVCAKKSGMSSEFTGLTATRMTRGDELPRHMISDSEWPRFLQATVTEWAAILDTSATTIISPAAARDIRKHLSHRIVPSRHVYREKPGEGVGAVRALYETSPRWQARGLPECYSDDLIAIVQFLKYVRYQFRWHSVRTSMLREGSHRAQCTPHHARVQFAIDCVTAPAVVWSTQGQGS